MKNKFWTREAPKKPGWYFAIRKYNPNPLPIHIRKDIDDGTLSAWTDCIAGLQLHLVKYWSREPIAFPPTPEESNEN